jgi:2-polyprenyl-3-methyl-5-hydroxy-6-metoxy-1,4-benzoquinol methylase
MTRDELDSLLAEQVAYYRARAAEYDATSPVPADDALREHLVHALEAFAPRGRILEFACGTGQWTAMLAAHASQLTAIDSSPEMLAIASSRIQDDHVRFIDTDIFAWQPDGRYDVVFFSAWLSHVPPQCFDRFWALVAECLDQAGRVFFVDELPAVEAHERVIPGAVAPAVERPLTSGARYRAVKVFYQPDELEKRLTALGWKITAHPVGWRFFYASGNRLTES